MTAGPLGDDVYGEDPTVNGLQDLAAARFGMEAAVCRTNGLAFRLDGVRLFNAPAGSLLLGTAAFIKQARRVRKAWGGGMRQAGVLASPFGKGQIRFVTHLDFDDAGLDHAVAALRKLTLA